MNLVLVKHYMSEVVLTLTMDIEMRRAAEILVQHGISGAPVVDEYGTLVGMLTEKDCLKTVTLAGYYGEPGGCVAEFMSREVKTVSPEASVVDVAELFLKTPYRRYPVIDNDRLVGIISRRDILRALTKLVTPSAPN